MSSISASVGAGADEESWGMRAASASTISGVTVVTSVTTTPLGRRVGWTGSGHEIGSVARPAGRRPRRATVQGTGRRSRGQEGHRRGRPRQGPPRAGTRRGPGVPNILLVVSDQERQRGWLPPSVALPWRDRLIAEGLEFTRLLHPLVALFAQSSQSPDRSLPARTRGDRQRDHARARRARSVGPHHRLAAAGHRLPLVVHRQMASVTGRPSRHGGVRVLRLGGQRSAFHGMGRDRCPLRPRHRLERRPLAAVPCRASGGTAASSAPALVLDRGPGQPARRHVVPGGPARVRREAPRGGGRHPPRPRERRLEGGRRPAHLRRTPTTRCSRSSRPISPTTSTPSPRRTGSGGGTSNTASGAISTRPTRKAWLRHLDYYVELHRLADRSLGTVLDGLGGERWLGRHRRDLHVRSRRHVRIPRTAVQGPLRLRRDHAGPAVHEGSRGDAAGPRRPTRWPPMSIWPPPSARWPASIRPGPAGTGGPTLQGVDLSPVLADPAASVRDHVLFAQDSAQTQNLNNVRYALRGFFDGTTKYARYYGVGGGKPSTGLWGKGPGAEAVRRRLRLR